MFRFYRVISRKKQHLIDKKLIYSGSFEIKLETTAGINCTDMVQVINRPVSIFLQK